MALTADQITANNFKKFYQAIEPYLSSGIHGGFTPVGSIIAVMGNDAPTNYLKCDGSVYSIADYPELANYFEEQFDNANFFGGDGATTFAVPDLRGEFLRGTGTNSHTDGGNGANVGVHQTPTGHVQTILNQGKYFGPSHDWNDSTRQNSTNIDKTLVTRSTNKVPYITLVEGTDSTTEELFASRPTNTSVLYCIAIKNIFLDATDFAEEVDENDVKEIIGSNMPSARQNFEEYSTDEQVIGKWIDGKPLYQKTVQIPVSTFSSSTGSSGYYTVGVPHNISNLKLVVDLRGNAYGNVVRPVPFSYGATSPDFSWFSSLGTNDATVFIECGSNFRQSVITQNTYGAYITLKYTKTTD